MKIAECIFLLFFSLQLFSQSSAETYLKLGQIKMYQGYFKDAIIDFNKTVKLNSNLWQAYLERAKAKLAISESNAAYEDITKAFDLEKNNAEIYYFRAKIYNSMGKYDQAFNDLTEALTLRPDYSEALSEKNLYYFLSEKRRPGNANP